MTAREKIEALLADLQEDTLEMLSHLLPTLTHLRPGSRTSAQVFGQFYSAGLPATLLLQAKGGAARAAERVEVSVITGRAVQLVFDFDAQRAS